MSKVIECDHAAPSIYGNLQTENTSQRAVQPYVCVELPFVSTNIRPDVSVVSTSSQPNDLKRFIFFCGNSISSSGDNDKSLTDSLRKLYLDLLIQLIHVRSYNKGTMSVSGLLVPSNTIQSRVVLTWNPYIYLKL